MIQPPVDLRFTELSSSTRATCGVTTAGTLGCWSYHVDMPSDVPTTSGWAHVSLYGPRACAIDDVGQVHCFGAWNPRWPSVEDALALR